VKWFINLEKFEVATTIISILLKNYKSVHSLFIFAEKMFDFPINKFKNPKWFVIGR